MDSPSRIQRFLSKIDVRSSGECWEWTGAKARNGYGKFGSYRDGKLITAIAHRYAFELFHGAIPEGSCILHSCDNRACVNPIHLSAGTRTDNMQDALRKGRLALGDRHPSKTHPECLRGNNHFAKRHPELVPRGEQRGHARLTADDVREMRRLREAGMFFSAIGEKFGVAYSTARKICLREKWAHIA